MEDMPIWFKIAIYATVGVTAIYAAWGLVQSFIPS